MAEMTTEDRKALPFLQLVQWAWKETPPVHGDRVNLLIHLVAVPLFVTGHMLLIAAIFAYAWFALAGFSMIVASLVAQKMGHAQERIEVAPFAGAKDFVRRLYAEQFCNFWRFLLSGGWSAAFRRSA